MCWVFFEVQYHLPHPLLILDNPPTKESYKKMVKAHIVYFWENKLRGEAAMMPSLDHCKANFMSLMNPHPIWTTAKGNPHEVGKAIQQASFISGRYRTEYFSRHWSDNPQGYCRTNDSCSNVIEDCKHILLECPSYVNERRILISLWLKTNNYFARKLALEALSNTSDYLLQFILDCSALPSVILASQRHGKDILDALFHLTRTWCFVLHRQRMRLLGRWNFV